MVEAKPGGVSGGAGGSAAGGVGGMADVAAQTEEVGEDYITRMKQKVAGKIKYSHDLENNNVIKYLMDSLSSPDDSSSTDNTTGGADIATGE